MSFLLSFLFSFITAIKHCDIIMDLLFACITSLGEFISDVPPKLYISSRICLFFVTVANPIILSYFRP